MVIPRTNQRWVRKNKMISVTAVTRKQAKS